MSRVIKFRAWDLLDEKMLSISLYLFSHLMWPTQSFISLIEFGLTLL